MNPALLVALAAQLSSFESRFMASVSTEQISAIHKIATGRPHIAGSPASLALADRLRDELKKAGLATEVHDFQVYLSTPRHLAAEITAPAREPLSVIEPPSPIDPDSAHPDLGPAFVAYSASGSVTAPVVVVGYGLPADYERLAQDGVDVRGRIAVARYGRSHRAVKIHTAEQHGAVGIIIYSDPEDDGVRRGTTWPDGPWRADFQAQRGNGKYSWFWHGDPLTPKQPATSATSRIAPEQADTLPKIPAVVLAWKEASKILKHPNATVHLDVEMDAGLRTIRDVIARIPGRDSSREVMLGTHHDAWTFGGMDPGSGLSAVFETARALAALRRGGWVPERDIVFAFWDAEEFGLLGSTEYAEKFQQRLRQRLVTYINTDLFMRGHFDGGGTPSLRDFVIQVTKNVPSFTGTGSVFDQWQSEARTANVELAALGSGADFVAFQDYLGVPTLQMEFDFAGSYGTYHSNYDTRWFVEHVSDPGFAVARTMAQLLGLTVMRLASADVLPFRYSHYADVIENAATVDAHCALAREIRQRAATLEDRIASRRAAGTLSASVRKRLNDRLVNLEQTLLDPGTAVWYRHVVYGWNIYALYEGQLFPGLEAAQRSGGATRIAEATAQISSALARMRDGLQAALDDLK